VRTLILDMTNGSCPKSVNRVHFEEPEQFRLFPETCPVVVAFMPSIQRRKAHHKTLRNASFDTFILGRSTGRSSICFGPATPHDVPHSDPAGDSDQPPTPVATSDGRQHTVRLLPRESLPAGPSPSLAASTCRFPAGRQSGFPATCCGTPSTCRWRPGGEPVWRGGRRWPRGGDRGGQ